MFATLLISLGKNIVEENGTPSQSGNCVTWGAPLGQFHGWRGGESKLLDATNMPATLLIPFGKTSFEENVTPPQSRNCDTWGVHLQFHEENA